VAGERASGHLLAPIESEKAFTGQALPQSRHGTLAPAITGVGPQLYEIESCVGTASCRERDVFCRAVQRPKPQRNFMRRVGALRVLDQGRYATE
jgi:hypothetical protein